MNRVLRCAVLIGSIVAFHPALFARPDGKESAPVELPVFHVEGKFSELLCGARFRYHIPGGKLKELVVRRMPNSWNAAGVKIGDAIIKIDGLELDGLSLPALGKHLQSTFKSGAAKYVFEIRSGETQKISRLEAGFEKDQREFTIAYP